TEDSPTDNRMLVPEQDSSTKPPTLLPAKKAVAFHCDIEETPAKQQSHPKQPPALPPKPLTRIANHIAGFPAAYTIPRLRRQTDRQAAYSHDSTIGTCKRPVGHMRAIRVLLNNADFHYSGLEYFTGLEPPVLYDF
ncbi:hypothetical protein scyTo_0020073, partial [Scyliorhinus torazame]|nr:hypothetical protein [Scyliorhinus torazame]